MANLSLALGKPTDTAVNAGRGEQGLQSEVFFILFFSRYLCWDGGNGGERLDEENGALTGHMRATDDKSELEPPKTADRGEKLTILDSFQSANRTRGSSSSCASQEPRWRCFPLLSSWRLWRLGLLPPHRPVAWRLFSRLPAVPPLP